MQFLQPFDISTSKLYSHHIIELIEKIFTTHEHRILSEKIFVNRYLREDNFLKRLIEHIDDIEYKNKKAKQFTLELKNKINSREQFYQIGRNFTA